MEGPKEGTRTDGSAQETKHSLTEEYEWVRCICDGDSCSSCRAERVAIISNYNTKPLMVDLRSVYQSQAKSVNSPKEATPDEELANDILWNTFSGSFNRYIPLATVEPAPGQAGTSLFIYWFHQSVSDSTILGRTEFSYASPMIVYLFACNFQQHPSELCSKVLPKVVQRQVLVALTKGNERYEVLYPGAQRELTPEETLQAWPDFKMKVLCDYSSNMAIYQSLYELILGLKEDQVLLIFRKKPYKVLSVVCTADRNAVCMFDSQMHRVSVGDEQGALLFYCEKQHDLVSLMLFRFEHYCFRIEGECHFLLLQRDTHVPRENAISGNSLPVGGGIV